MKNRFLPTIYASDKTVFTVNDIVLMFPRFGKTNVSRVLSYYVNSGGLLRLRKGIYAKENYNVWELANKLYSPSYISFFTILEKNGMIFQHDPAIHIASYTTREIRVGEGKGEKKLVYHKLKQDILLNDSGVLMHDGVWVASAERAFLDTVYLYGEFYIDNLKPLNWDKVFALQKLYKNVTLEKRVENYYSEYAENYFQS